MEAFPPAPMEAPGVVPVGIESWEDVPVTTTVRLLASRILVVLALPVAGCWAVDTSSETVEGSPGPDGVCRDRDDPALSLYVAGGSRCTPRKIERIDEGPIAERRPDGKLRCLYLVTISRTQRPEFCISGGRPLVLRDRPVAAPLVRRAWS